MSDNVTEFVASGRVKHLCMADENYLKWYEMLNALPHLHAQKLFSLFQQKLQRYIKKVGKSDISTMETMQCFHDAATELANKQVPNAFQSILVKIEEDNI